MLTSAAVTRDAGTRAMKVAFCEVLGVPSRNRTENVHAHRIINDGQSAYVEPHTCCDRNAPFTVAIRINGSASAIPGRSILARRKLHKANASETTKTNGHSARSCSARSAGSLSVKSDTTAHTNGTAIRKIDSAVTTGRAFRFKENKSAPPRNDPIRQIICGSAYTATKSAHEGRRRSAAN